MAKRKRVSDPRISLVRDARKSGPPLSRRQRLVGLLWARPIVSVELLALLASIFFALVSNRAFWHAARDAGAFEGINGAAVAVAVFILLVCVHVVLLYVVLLRVTAKVVLTLLLVAGAVISHAASANGTYLDPESMRTALQSNVVTPSALGSWSFAWTLVTQAGLPVLLLWRVQVARFSFPIALERRVMAVVTACAFATLAMVLPQHEIRRLMRDHRALHYLVTPANLMTAVSLRVDPSGHTATPADRTVVPKPPSRVLPPQDAPPQPD
ncbi:MAG: DUF1705 domain-containing protein [Rhodanobacteraceae bacterium]|nr:DUF1705 domain-containing protein [Rhodanobacteraceae bacterium]